MIYLDYSSTTPVLPEVLDSFIKVSKDYFANPNSLHSLGEKSKNLMNGATKQISELLKIREDEVIYTSGSTESNNIDSHMMKTTEYGDNWACFSSR